MVGSSRMRLTKVAISPTHLDGRDVASVLALIDDQYPGESAGSRALRLRR